MRLGAMAFYGAALYLTSCTTMNYKSSGEINTSFSPKERHVHKKEAVGKKEFYLWGLLPSEHTVFIDRELAGRGLISAANITIEEYQNTSDRIWTWISFGLYVPKHYSVSGFGVQTDDRRE